MIAPRATWLAAGAAVLGAGAWLWLREAQCAQTPATRIADNHSVQRPSPRDRASLGSLGPSAQPNSPESLRPAAPPTVPATASSAADDRQRLEEARARVRDDPAQALRLIAAAEQQRPESARAEQWSLLKVHALVYLGQLGLARDEAEAFLARYPQGPNAARIEALTGVHPRAKETE